MLGWDSALGLSSSHAELPPDPVQYSHKIYLCLMTLRQYWQDLQQIMIDVKAAEYMLLFVQSFCHSV